MNTADQSTHVGFFEAFFGLFTAPRETTEALFSDKRPQHVGTLLFLVVMTIFGPIFLHFHKNPSLISKPEALSAAAIASCIAFLLFIFTEVIFLRLFGVKVRMADIVASIVYSTVPLAVLFVTVFAINTYFKQSFSLVSFIFSGYKPQDSKLLDLLPVILILTNIICINVFFFCLRAMSGVLYVSAVAMAILSLIPLYFSILVALTAADLVIPNSLLNAQKLFVAPETILSLGKT